MESSDRIPWQSLERWSPTAFALGGVAWLILMSIVIAGRFVEASTPVWFFPLFLILGLSAAYAGLLGIYPRVRDLSPRLSLAGAGTIVIAVALVVFAVVYTVATGTVAEGPPFPVFPLMILSTILSFLLVGFASFRAEMPSRTVGILVIFPGIAWAGDIVFIAISSTLGIQEVGGIALIIIPMLGIVAAGLAMVGTGYLLHARYPLSGRPEPAPDSTV